MSTLHYFDTESLFQTDQIPAPIRQIYGNRHQNRSDWGLARILSCRCEQHCCNLMLLYKNKISPSKSNLKSSHPIISLHPTSRTVLFRIHPPSLVSTQTRFDTARQCVGRQRSPLCAPSPPSRAAHASRPLGAQGSKAASITPPPPPPPISFQIPPLTTPPCSKEAVLF